MGQSGARSSEENESIIKSDKNNMCTLNIIVPIEDEYTIGYTLKIIPTYTCHTPQPTTIFFSLSQDLGAQSLSRCAMCASVPSKDCLPHAG